MTASNSIIDQYAVMDQGERQSSSENIKCDICHRMRREKTLSQPHPVSQLYQGDRRRIADCTRGDRKRPADFRFLYTGERCVEEQKVSGVPWDQDGHWKSRVEHLHHRPDVEQ